MARKGENNKDMEKAAPKAYMIEWEDSRQPKSAWQWLSDFDTPEIVRCISIGFLIYNGKDAKVLAPNIGDHDNEEPQVSGVIQIPTRCVTRMVELKGY